MLYVQFLARLYKNTGRAIALHPVSALALMLAVVVAALTKPLLRQSFLYKTLDFLNPQMDLLYINYDYRCWSKILFSTIHTPAHDLEVKVTGLKILCQSF